MADWFKRWRRRDRDIQDEIEYHLEMLAQDQMDRGMPSEQAKFAARRKLGNTTRAKERMRDVWVVPVIEEVLQDLRYTVRSVRNAPAFFLLVIGILALGIGASVSVFSLVDCILLRPLPYRDSQRLVMLTSYAPRPPFDSNGSVSFNDFSEFRKKSHSFSDLAITFRTGWSRVTLTAGAEPVNVQGAFVSSNLFALAGREPILGRTFTGDEDRRGERVVVISDGLWSERFGASPDVLGRDLEIGHQYWKIIGVAPADFQLPFLNTQIWAPLHAHPEWNHFEEANPLDHEYWDVLGRLKPGRPIASAQTEASSIWRGLRSALPESHTNDVRVVGLREHFFGNARRPALLLLGAVLFLLLIACVNVANLLLARSTQRARELSVRAALGAGRARLLRQLITEAVALSSLAGALGALVALQLVPLLKLLAPANILLIETVSLNKRGLLFALAISIFVGVLLGVAPLLRISLANLGAFMNGAGRSYTEGRRDRHIRNLLVVGEFALAMVLLTGAGLLIRSFIAVMNVNVGFRPQHILTLEFTLPDAVNSSLKVTQLSRIYGDLMRRTAALPAVVAVGGTSNLFFLDERRTHGLRVVEGRPPEPTSKWTPLVWTQIAGDYFPAMGIPLLKGRFFDSNDRPDSPLVAIVSDTLARRYWPGVDPLGKRFKGFDQRGKHDDWLTVVGVVGDVRAGGLERNPFAQVYELKSQEPGELLSNLIVRTTGDPTRIAADVRRIVRNANPNIVISSVSSMEALLGRQEIQRKFQTWLIGVFSAIALALAALGIFAIMHYSVAARGNEIGIRISAGATPGDIKRLMLSGATRVASCGVVTGGIAAICLTRAMTGLLYQVEPIDPVSFAGAAVLLFVAAVVACYLPARRAAHIDPLQALRQE